MFRWIIISLLFLASLINSQSDQVAPAVIVSRYQHIDKIYQQAGKLSQSPDYDEKTEAAELLLNQQALKGFTELAPVLENLGNDSLAFHSYLKAGILFHYFDSLDKARLYYQKAIDIKNKAVSLLDSFLFKPYLYSGNIYYASGQYDTAFTFYKKAEEIADKTEPIIEDEKRLYNTLGASYYETGNYRQAKNYFNKAITSLEPGIPFYKDLLVNYRINLASTLNKLEEYDEAKSIYEELLREKVNTNEILHNIGTIHLKLGAGQQALANFRHVNYTNNKIIRLLNDQGFAYAMLGQYDSAMSCYKRALHENERWNGEEKNAGHGQTLKLIGDEMQRLKNFDSASRYYQLAIMQFDAPFRDSSINQNPSHFTGVFSYIQLFHTLVAKAEALEQWGGLEHLKQSLAAYESAYALADYVEKIYDSDEARLFLNRIKHTAHNKPIDVSLRLYELTRDKKHLEAAYQFDQQNKASVLSFNKLMSEVRSEHKSGDQLQEEEANLRSAITRLSLKASQTSDPKQLNELHANLRDYEMQLGRIQDKLSADPAWQQKKFTQRIPAVKEVQDMLDPQTALLSYHLADTSILVLQISASEFNYKLIPITRQFYLQIDSIKSGLQTMQSKPDDRFAGTLFKILVEPINMLKNQSIKRLIIIPDDELHYLPFETLQDSNNDYLVEKYSIQYQYSTSMLRTQTPIANAHTLAIAPFTVEQDFAKDSIQLNRLPASGEEIENLDGLLLKNEKSTRSAFLTSAPGYPILHLATHAYVNNEDPGQSFIAFYPGDSAYRLYAAEIANMKLDSTDLVVLSACETGTGQLVKGEGLMSLSRAFAYAGCENIITSLWKAEDKTTAYITQRLHRYIAQGNPKDKALQQAKLDLLNSTSIDPRFKSPSHWAHLIFIGQYEPVKDSHKWWWISGGILLFGIGVWLFKRKLRKRREKGS